MRRSRTDATDELAPGAPTIGLAPDRTPPVTAVGGWLLVPLVLAALCVGIGLLAERLAGQRVPGPLVPGLGLAGLVVVGDVLWTTGVGARFAAPVCAAAAVAGFAVGRPWRDERLRGAWRPAAVTAGGAFAVYALPSLLSGQASIAGYIKLDDSAVWLALTDRLLDHGRDLGGLAPSSYRRTLEAWLGNGYPVGAFVPFGIGARLTGQDVANAYQPAIAVGASMLALGLHTAVRRLTGPWLAAAAALIGVQASLTLGYAQWGGVKELTLAALLVTGAGLAAAAQRRSLALVALAAVALVDVAGVSATPWAGLVLAAGAVVGWRGADRAASWPRRAAGEPAAGPRRNAWLRPVAAALGVLLVGSVPVLAVLGTDVELTTKGQTVLGQAELGKLTAPLDLLQAAGLWPAGDFRAAPAHHTLAVGLAVAGLLAAACAVAVAVRRRDRALPVLVAVTLGGTLPALAVASPWVDAKLLAIAAPVPLTAAATAVAVLLRRPAPSERWTGIVAGLMLLTAAAFSTTLVAQEVNVAPRDMLAEQRALGEEIAGRGPALMLDYDAFASRHFLRRADTEGATDLRFRSVPDRNGREFPDYGPAEVDDVDTTALYGYRVLVRRRTPVGSRPPSGFAQTWRGRFYEAWTRSPERPVPLAHVPLAAGLAPAAVPRCAAVRRLARTLGARVLVAAPRTNPVLVALDTGRLPAGWTATGVPATDGQASVRVTVPSAGRWRVWVGGMVRGQLGVTVDGAPVGAMRHQLDAAVGWMRFGARELRPGRHDVRLDVRSGLLRAGAGSAATRPPLGPIALTPEAPEPLIQVPVAQARRLCDGRSYDWLEALA